MNGQELLSSTVEVTHDQFELDLGSYKDVQLYGSTTMGQVGAYMLFDGVIFGSIGMGSASYDMFRIGEGELRIFCHLSDNDLQ